MFGVKMLWEYDVGNNLSFLNAGSTYFTKFLDQRDSLTILYTPF